MGRPRWRHRAPAGLPVRGQGQGVLQEAQGVSRRRRDPYGEPLTAELLPKLLPLPSFERKKVALPKAMLVTHPGHQGITAQKFPGAFQDDVNLAVTQDG